MGCYRDAEYFISLVLGVKGPLLEDYCILGVRLVDHFRLLSPLLFFTPFILPEEMNGLGALGVI